MMNSGLSKSWSFSRKRRLLIWAGGLGERVQYAWRQRPRPSDAIVLAGPGRSGTTWLAQILTAGGDVQVIFEPLNPVWSDEVAALTGWGKERLAPRGHYLPADAEAPAWYDFLQRVLTGQVRSVGTDYERTSFFPRRYLVKLIRANLMLGYLARQFGPRLIYVQRHPCATISSRLQAGWRADVDALLQQEQLVEDYLRPWLAEMERVDDPIEAAAVVWAVENMVALRELTAVPHLTVTYEALVLKPELYARRILDWASLPVPPNLRAMIARPSRQASRTRHQLTPQERLGAWQQALSPGDQRHILRWSAHLGLAEYDENILPRSLLSEPNEPALVSTAEAAA